MKQLLWFVLVLALIVNAAGTFLSLDFTQHLLLGLATGAVAIAALVALIRQRRRIPA
ncbi:MAG TPA: hypothetical protein VGP16_32260 [Asanoa sp.]|jgi:hypothetical protein|nr:hypothetical protein [Asanoa sp.]